MARPSWDTYFLGLATHAATRATCPRLAVGAVAVRDKRVLSTGYNGTAPGMPHCQHAVDTPCTEAVHAEVQEFLDGLAVTLAATGKAFSQYGEVIRAASPSIKARMTEIAKVANPSIKSGRAE